MTITHTEPMLFSAQEWHRYTRHIQLSKFGVNGQRALKKAHVIIIGAGGLGCPSSQYLAAAGVGKITLVDADVVSRTNLQRQILFSEADIGHPKVDAAATKLRQNNPYIEIATVRAHLTLDNAETLLSNADLILDCSDNFACRYLINDTCLSLGKPWVFASIGDYSGQLALFTPETACFRCLFPNTPSTAVDCNSAGVLGVLPGQLGIMQATMALQYLAQLPGLNAGKLILVEALYQETRHINLKPAPECHCQTGHTIIEPHSGIHCSSDAIQTSGISTISPAQFSSQRDDYHIIDVRQFDEYEGFNTGACCIPFAPASPEFLAAIQSQVTVNTPILLICQSGVRSAKASQQLQSEGYTSVTSLQGGIAGWLQWSFENH